MSQAGMSNTLGLLKASYSDSLRANDRQYSLIAYPMRFVSFWLTLPFVRLGFSANQVTLTRMLTTLIATGCLATGNTWAVRGASLLVPLQWLLDSVDGNVARLRQQSSRQGYFLDVLADATSHGLLPIGIALGSTSIRIGSWRLPASIMMRSSGSLPVRRSSPSWNVWRICSIGGCRRQSSQ